MWHREVSVADDTQKLYQRVKLNGYLVISVLPLNMALVGGHFPSTR